MKLNPAAGIERQEAAGQRTLCATLHLPRVMHGARRQQLEGLGFSFGADMDDLFVEVTMPPGWVLRPTGHSMYTDLNDERGRRRATVFYKATFYDRRANLIMRTRYSVSLFENGSPGRYTVWILSDGEHLWSIGEYARSGFERGIVLLTEATGWLDKHFPDWRDPFAYWA